MAKTSRSKSNSLLAIVGRIKNLSVYLAAVEPITLRLSKSAARPNPVDGPDFSCDVLTSANLSDLVNAIAADLEALIGTPEAATPPKPAPAPKAGQASTKKR